MITYNNESLSDNVLDLAYRSTTNILKPIILTSA